MVCCSLDPLHLQDHTTPACFVRFIQFLKDPCCLFCSFACSRSMHIRLREEHLLPVIIFSIACNDVCLAKVQQCFRFSAFISVLIEDLHGLRCGCNCRFEIPLQEH